MFAFVKYIPLHVEKKMHVRTIVSAFPECNIQMIYMKQLYLGIYCNINYINNINITLKYLYVYIVTSNSFEN